jgi:hypothetical protein
MKYILNISILLLGLLFCNPLSASAISLDTLKNTPRYRLVEEAPFMTGYIDADSIRLIRNDTNSIVIEFVEYSYDIVHDEIIEVKRINFYNPKRSMEKLIPRNRTYATYLKDVHQDSGVRMAYTFLAFYKGDGIIKQEFKKEEWNERNVIDYGSNAYLGAALAYYITFGRPFN